MKLWLCLLFTLSFFLYPSQENEDYASKLRKFLGEGEKLYNIYIRPYNQKITVLSRRVHGDGYKYFGLGLEYENPIPKLKLFKYTYLGRYRLDKVSDTYEIPPDSIFFLIPNCQIIILTQKTENGREVLFLDSEFQKLQKPNLEKDLESNLDEFYEKLAYASKIRLKRNSLTFQTQESSLEYSIPLQRILDPEKYEITPTGFCRVKGDKQQ